MSSVLRKHFPSGTVITSALTPRVLTLNNIVMTGFYRLNNVGFFKSGNVSAVANLTLPFGSNTSNDSRTTFIVKIASDLNNCLASRLAIPSSIPAAVTVQSMPQLITLDYSSWNIQFI